MLITTALGQAIDLPVDLEDVSCPLGCARNDKRVLTGGDRLHHLPGRFHVVQCQTCGLLRTNPRPTPETIGFYYPAHYGPYASTGMQSTKLPRWVKRASDFLTRSLGPLADFGAEALPPVLSRTWPGRMLEIGCASGSFLRRMAALGWQVHGIEFSPEAARVAAAPGYVVHAGPLETAPAPDQPFDLVAGWMTLEHLHDPVAGLRKLRDWTRRDGWLAISVPNSGSFEYRLFGAAWFALDLPRHLFHFTSATITKVLAAGGWQVNRIAYQRDIGNSVASIGYLARDRGLVPRLADALITYPWWGGRLNVALLPLSYPLSLMGQTGRMTIWARRAKELGQATP